MIIKKEITATLENLDGVVLELAEEVKKGYTIKSITLNDGAIQRDTRGPKFIVKMERAVGPD